MAARNALKAEVATGIGADAVAGRSLVRMLPVVIASVLFALSTCLAQHVDTSRIEIEIGVAIGIGIDHDGNRATGGSVTLRHESVMLSVRALDIYASTLGDDGMTLPPAGIFPVSTSIFTRSIEGGLMIGYGRRRRGSRAYIAALAGVSIVAIDRTTVSFYSDPSGFDKVFIDLRPERRLVVALPVEVRMVWTPTEELGLGLSVAGSHNTLYPLFGIVAQFHWTMGM